MHPKKFRLLNLDFMNSSLFFFNFDWLWKAFRTIHSFFSWKAQIGVLKYPAISLKKILEQRIKSNRKFIKYLGTIKKIKPKIYKMKYLKKIRSDEAEELKEICSQENGNRAIAPRTIATQDNWLPPLSKKNMPPG